MTREEQILEILKEGGKTISDLHKKGIPRSSAAKALEHLLDKGKIELRFEHRWVNAGRFGMQYRSVQVYRIPRPVSHWTEKISFVD